MASRKREQLVETALRLFDRYGFHATGIDRILAESGVAKMTLYNNFRSKDELILAALRRRDETFRNWFVRAVELRAETPRERLLAMFDALAEWFRDRGFNGCPFVGAAWEFDHAARSIRAGCTEHKRLMRDYVRSLAADSGAADSDGLADALMLLMEGATVTAQVCGEADAAATGRSAADVLIRNALAQ